jgi:L-threonylcarbamoyladenylate synthase
MTIIEIKDKDSLLNAAEVLKRGGILVFPTDTVYGIGCLLNEKSIKRLYKIKNRPLDQPTAVLFNKNIFFSKQLYDKVRIPKNIKDSFFQGKTTIIFSKRVFKIIFPEILLKHNKIGIRLPKLTFLEELIDKIGPIAASSANKKGERPPAKFTEIEPDIIEHADLIIKTDEKLSGKPSRVYDLELKKYLR